MPRRSEEARAILNDLIVEMAEAADSPREGVETFVALASRV
jgi:hypothetical protein